jgi:hypothetical protein
MNSMLKKWNNFIERIGADKLLHLFLFAWVVAEAKMFGLTAMWVAYFIMAVLSVIKEFLPQPLTDDEIKDLISKAITEVNAQAMSDMAKVMQYLKPLVVGRTDMGALSKMIKEALTK